MKRFLTVVAVSLATASAAFACEDGHCDKEHCNMPSSTADAPLPADGTHVKLAVAGMHCGACADKVKTALIGVDGVKGATVDVSTGLAEVAYDAAKATPAKLVAAVAATGNFTATVAQN
jgi:copper chaperone CopZ